MIHMRRTVLLLAVAAVLVGCERKGVGLPVLRGSDKGPYTAEGKKPADARYVEFICPACGNRQEPGSSPCEKRLPGQEKNCKTELTWADAYVCVNCRGSGQCQGCLVYGGEGGKCWKCGGSGWTRDDVECANCWKSPTDLGKCPICLGDSKCDWCKGENAGEAGLTQMTMDQLKAHARGTQPEPPTTPPTTPPTETTLPEETPPSE